LRISADVPSAPRQPEMTPSMLTKRNASLLKLVVSLNTWPVGLPAPGMLTSRLCLMTWGKSVESFVTAYNVARPVPLLFTQKVLVGLKDIPQGLTRFVSRTIATRA